MRVLISQRSLENYSFALLLLGFLLPSSWTHAQTGGNSDLISDGTQAKYFKGTVAPPTDWTSLGFDDSITSWIEGHVPFGYGESHAVAPKWTVLSDMRNQYLTVYFRIPFHIELNQEVTSITIDTIFDDGVVLYLNGKEIGRSDSLPNDPLNFDTHSKEHEHTQPSLVINSPDLIHNLRPGMNLLAAELHNTNISSSDAIFQPRVTVSTIEKTTSNFIRGADCDNNPSFNIADPIYLLRWVFLGGDEPDCTKACDLNDDGLVDSTDAIFSLQYMFIDGIPPESPFPLEGPDPTVDELQCERVVNRIP